MTVTLDSTILGSDGAVYDEQTTEDRGRGCMVEWISDTVDQEMIIFGYTIRFYPTEPEAKETP